MYKSTCVEYCSHLWDGSAKYLLDALDRLQRRAVRIVNDADVTKLIEPLQLCRDIASLSVVYRLYHGQKTVKVDQVRDNAPQTTMDSRCDGSKPSDCVIGGAQAFILRVSSFFGLAPLRFESHTSGFVVTISNPMCIYSYVLITVLVTCTMLGLAAEINVGVEVSVRMSSKISQVVSTCDVLVVVVTACAGVYGAPKRMENMLKYMKSVASVDKSIGGQYSVKTERKLCAILLAILIFFLILIVDDFCFYIMQAKKLDRHWDVLVNYIGFYLLWCIVIILELQFAFTALSVRARFAAVNDALCITAEQVAHTVEKTKTSSPLNIFAIGVSSVETQRSCNVCLLTDSLLSREPPVVINKSVSGEPCLAVSPCEAVYRLAALHGTLCDVVNRVNDSYGLPLVVVLISTLLHLIVTPYFLILEIISMNRLHFLVLQFLWCGTHLFRLFVVVEPCHYTINEGKRTETLISRLMAVTPFTGALQSRLELFSRQLMLQGVTYVPMGICTLDRPLVASVIGAITTYLVILIQFHKSETNN